MHITTLTDIENTAILEQAATIAFMRPTDEGGTFGMQVVKDPLTGTGWRVTGLGFAGIALEPYTDTELLGMLDAATRIMWQPNASTAVAFRVDR